jgi:hypothetical protein
MSKDPSKAILPPRISGIRSHKSKRKNKVYIGGEIQIHHLMEAGFNVFTLARFEDFENDEKATFQNFANRGYPKIVIGCTPRYVLASITMLVTASPSKFCPAPLATGLTAICTCTVPRAVPAGIAYSAKPAVTVPGAATLSTVVHAEPLSKEIERV